MADGAAISILGGEGMLGSALFSECRREGVEAQVFDLPDFDITNKEHIEEVVGKSGAVMNCAAYTDVDRAQSEIGRAYKVNAEAVGELGRAAAKFGVWVLHISTDFVFDGLSARPYVEADRCNPINVYGRSKLAGEKLLIESGCAGCIMRIEWTYGHKGNNFVTGLIEAARKGKPLRVVDDQVGSPTAVSEVAKVICKLFSIRPEGVFHFASRGYVSRYGMAEFIFGKLRMKVDLQSCPSSEYPSTAERPLNSRFDCTKIQRLLGEPIERWEKPLEEFIKQL